MSAARCHLNLNEYPDAAERFLRLALKAQSQGKANIETLAQMKNPSSVAFVKHVAHPSSRTSLHLRSRREQQPHAGIEYFLSALLIGRVFLALQGFTL